MRRKYEKGGESRQASVDAMGKEQPNSRDKRGWITEGEKRELRCKPSYRNGWGTGESHKQGKAKKRKRREKKQKGERGEEEEEEERKVEGLVVEGENCQAALVVVQLSSSQRKQRKARKR
jgi:hypothetical protein